MRIQAGGSAGMPEAGGVDQRCSVGTIGVGSDVEVLHRRLVRGFLDQFYDEIYPYAGVFAPWIGTTGSAALKLGEARAISVADLKTAHEGWFPTYMAGEIAA